MSPPSFLLSLLLVTSSFCSYEPLCLQAVSLVYLVQVGGHSATLGFSSEPGAAHLGIMSTLTLQSGF